MNKNELFQLVLLRKLPQVLGFGIIGPIQLRVKRQFSRLCILTTLVGFFLPVSDKNCHSPFRKVKRQPTLIISFSRQSPFFEGQIQPEIRLASGVKPVTK